MPSATSPRGAAPAIAINRVILIRLGENARAVHKFKFMHGILRICKRQIPSECTGWHILMNIWDLAHSQNRCKIDSEAALQKAHASESLNFKLYKYLFVA